MKALNRRVVAFGVALSLPLPVHAEGATTTEAPAPSPKCLKAVVNPVTGHAICVDPRGAAVEPPPRSALQRPCKPRAHDGDPWTVYEHWSGCHE